MERNCFFQVKSVINQAFGDKITLLSSVDDLFELEMAFLEQHLNVSSVIHQSIGYQKLFALLRLT